MKKFGFFYQAIDILKDLEKKILEEMEKPKSGENGSITSLKKELFKVYRD